MGVVSDLNRGKCFQMDGGEALLEPTDQVYVILKWKIRMQAAHNVKLGYRFRPALSGLSECLVKCHRICARLFRFTPEGAKFAAGDAHVRGVDVTINVKVCAGSVQFHSHMMGKVTQREQI